MRIAVPNKGRLHEPSMELLENAGLHVLDGADRKLYAETVDPDVTLLFARAADIPEYVRDGAADVGITGLDQVHESGREGIVDLLDLGYGTCRLVLAAPEDDEVAGASDLDGKVVATEFPTIARDYFDERGVSPEIVEVTGATELTPHVDMADAIIDITSTGTTLAVNRLEIVDTVLESSVHLFAREDVVEGTSTAPGSGSRDATGDAKIDQVVTALRSVLSAEGKRYLMMNVPAAKLEAVKEVIPGMGGPTVMDIAGQDALAVHAVVDERRVFETIAALREEGASDILVTEIERLVE